MRQEKGRWLLEPPLCLERADNKNFRVELIPDVAHNLIISETGCIEERNRRSRIGWRNYSPLYLDT